MSRTLAGHPDVSVVVCTHNRAALLADALGSLLELETDDGLAYEIVVVDNASTDATADVVRNIAARAGAGTRPQAPPGNAIPDARHPDAALAIIGRPDKLPGNAFPDALHPPGTALAAVRYVFESRKGIATARNRGVAEARGSWIAFFDDDQWAEPRWLVELLATARQQRVRCVGGRVDLKLPAGCERRLAPVCRMLLGGTVGPDELRRYNHRVTPGAGNLLVHRTVFDQIGRFDESFNRRGEDTDLFLRMLSAGIEGWYTPRAIVQHVIPPERLSAAWFLDTAWRTAEGIAADERQAWGAAAYPLVWLARVVQAAALVFPRWLAAQLLGDAERALGARCRLVMARRHLSEGLRLLVPRSRPRGPFLARREQAC